MESGLGLSTNTPQLLKTLATTGRAMRLAGLTGGLADLTSQWARHVEETEQRLFPSLVARGPAADGPVGFCLAEHAALSARLANLAALRLTPEWLHEAETLIGRLIQHVFLEARVLQPLLDRAGIAWSLSRGDSRTEERAEG
jgi:hemerythrin HHE cation binding domain-containing protein